MRGRMLFLFSHMMPKTLLQIPCGYSMPFFLRINVHYITPCLKIRFTLVPIQIWLFVSFPSNGIQMPVKRKSMESKGYFHFIRLFLKSHGDSNVANVTNRSYVTIDGRTNLT